MLRLDGDHLAQTPAQPDAASTRGADRAIYLSGGCGEMGSDEKRSGDSISSERTIALAILI
jgi:hypothetical protein